MSKQGFVYDEALAAAHDCSDDTLLSYADAWSSVVADENIHEVERLLCGERLQAVKDELVRRKRLAATAMPYREYLKTDHWQCIRQKALDAAEHRCQLCYSAYRLEVHHRTYHRLGSELLSDLTVLCSDCHGWFHRRLRRIEAEQ